ncbi:hypothetical protein DPMN_182878 [Dreissena polymorpha]|uniref:Uncharacterized protein n=2 Tax=Dreissena polymorpha TaxID=45954 RepID=A0A9D4I5U9_DREPO|nr:hypothetical protein DPMN_182878 [Dreissena polymorpha]
MPCPTNCAGGADGRLCSSDGTCINGCRLGFGGSQCNVTCPVTCAEVASGSRCSDNGSCAAGCIDRYSGEKCKLLTSTESSAAYTSGNAAAIAGPVVGGVCFIAGCVIITLLVMKKRQKQKDTNEYYNVRTFAAGSQATPANTQKDAESDYTDLGVSREQMNTYSSLREGSHILNSQQTHRDAETNYTTLGDKRGEGHTYSNLSEGNSLS